MPALLASLLLASAGASAEWPTTVDALEVEGLWRTVPSVVSRELPWEPGDEVTEEQWAFGLARLWNMGLFSRVDGQLEERHGRTVAVLTLEERFTINPLFRFSTAGSAGWLRLGASDTNLFGRFLEVGAQYERFGSYNGGQAWVRDPRFLDRRLNGLVQLERLARPRPGFVVFRSLARFEATGFVDSEDRVSLLGRVDVLSDRYDRVEGDAGVLPPPSEGAIVTVGGKFGRVDTVRLRQRGWSVAVQPSLGVTNDSPGVFGQLFVEALAFAMPGQRWTLAARLQAGASTAAPVQHRFYVGGLDLVRGLPDNHLRTGAYAVANVEARFVAWDSTWLAFVPTAFVDGVVARGESVDVEAIATAGAGLRVLIPKLVSSGFRADLAVTLDGEWALQPSFGVFQFF